MDQRAVVTERLVRGAARYLASMGAGVVTEFRLTTGRRLDLMALLPDGRLWAIEVKSCADDFRSDAKWPEYREWCDALWFCVDVDFPQDMIPEGVGLMVADAFDAHVAREAPEHSLHASRRKAVTLKFALCAARRLQGMDS